MLSCITHISYLSYADWWHLTWAHKTNQITQDRASLFIFRRVFGIGRKNTIRWIILRLKFVRLKGFEMRVIWKLLSHSSSGSICSSSKIKAIYRGKIS